MEKTDLSPTSKSMTSQKKFKISSPKTKDFWEIPVIYEDDEIFVVDKPSGLAIRQDADDPMVPALNLLFVDHIQRKVPWTVEFNTPYLKACHDLDPEASGALIVARSEKAYDKIHEQFFSHKSVVRYTILIQGTPMEEKFSVDVQVGPNGKRPGTYCVSKNRGKRSLSHFKVLEHFTGYTLVEAECIPNRLHQARVHMRYLGPSLVGDAVYNGVPLLLSRLKPNYRLKRKKTERPLMARPAIHCSRVHFESPLTGEMVSVDCPIPKDMEVTLKYLRQYADPAGIYEPESYSYSLADYEVETGQEVGVDKSEDDSKSEV